MAEIGEGYSAFLRELGEAYPEVVVVDAGLATSMQTDRFRDAFPERYFNLGIAEQNAVGVASGLARRGFVPLVHSFSNFLARRAHEQVAVSVAWPGCPVKLIAGACGLFDGRNGPSHLATDDLAAMSALPGVMVVEPGDLAQTRELLFTIVAYQGPAYFRLRRHGAPRQLLGDAPTCSGTTVVHRSPDAAVTLVAAGSLLEKGIETMDLLADRNIQIDLLHVSVLCPFNAEPIITSGQRTGLIVTLENHVASGGFGDAVAAAVGPLGISNERLAIPRELLPAGDANWLLAYCRLDAPSVAKRIIDLLDGR